MTSSLGFFIKLWRENAEQWIQGENPSCDLSALQLISGEALNEGQLAQLRTWFDTATWPKASKGDIKSVLKALPRVDHGWDFPPRVYRERQQRLKELQK